MSRQRWRCAARARGRAEVAGGVRPALRQQTGTAGNCCVAPAASSETAQAPSRAGHRGWSSRTSARPSGRRPRATPARWTWTIGPAPVSGEMPPLRRRPSQVLDRKPRGSPYQRGGPRVPGPPVGAVQRPPIRDLFTAAMADRRGGAIGEWVRVFKQKRDEVVRGTLPGVSGRPGRRSRFRDTPRRCRRRSRADDRRGPWCPPTPAARVGVLRPWRDQWVAGCAAQECPHGVDEFPR